MTNETFTPNNFWHMQMHPTNEQGDFAPNIPYILEQCRFIGLGEWEGGQEQIERFRHKMQVNDIVAIRDGAKFIALVQVIGGAYQIKNDSDPRTKWIENRRPIRILDWEIDGKKVRECPAPMGTINRCTNDHAETTQIIKEWYEKVATMMTARGVALPV